MKPDRLALTGGKTGPRDVLLGKAARTLLAGLARTPTGEWGFAENGADAPIHKNALYHLWLQVREQAGIEPTHGCTTSATATPRTPSWAARAYMSQVGF